jgi:hypothetical protein
MGRDYVSELRPPTGLLFIPRVISEHGEPWWWWCRLGITPDSSTRALWQSYQQRHLRQVGGMDEGVRILPISIWNTSRDLEHAVKSYDMGPPGLVPVRRKMCCGFLSPLKIHRLGRVWTRNPWVQWQALTATPPRRLRSLVVNTPASYSRGHRLKSRPEGGLSWPSCVVILVVGIGFTGTSTVWLFASSYP